MHCQGLDFKVNLTYCNVKHKKINVSEAISDLGSDVQNTYSL